MEQSTTTPPLDSELLGEIRTRIIGVEFDDIVPLKQPSPAELQRLQQQAKGPKAYRAELYKRHPLEQRMRDLSSAK